MFYATRETVVIVTMEACNTRRIASAFPTLTTLLTQGVNNLPYYRNTILLERSIVWLWLL